jgi:hypothetical protein
MLWLQIRISNTGLGRRLFVCRSYGMAQFKCKGARLAGSPPYLLSPSSSLMHNWKKILSSFERGNRAFQCLRLRSKLCVILIVSQPLCHNGARVRLDTCRIQIA